jgi:murein DD-endopeptidase MepM/ murein hydrolase activator NlpD
MKDPTSDEAMDRFRGRQVWIDHGGGVVTRYAHLLGIAPGITAGLSVKAGQVIAYVGESGTPESVTNPGTENHLHFELRVGQAYLGQGQSAAKVRQEYKALFSPPP